MSATDYDCIIVGGGIAGLQASIQLGRYMHKVLVIDKGTGRSTLCRSYHNVLGYPDGVSGEHLRRVGRGQAEALGVRFETDEAVEARRIGDGHFTVKVRGGQQFEAPTLLIATGVMDRLPDLPGLIPCLGRTVYICPDCDGYEVRDKTTIVMGAGGAGVHMAIALSYYTSRLTLVNHACARMPEQTVSAEDERKLQNKGVELVDGCISEVLAAGDGKFVGVRMAGGRELKAERGFIAFGGNAVNTELLKQLGAERMESKHVISDPRTKMTNVPGLFAAGDINVHAEQMTVAMGEGQLAAIWMHKELLRRKLNAAKDNREPAGKT